MRHLTTPDHIHKRETGRAACGMPISECDDVYLSEDVTAPTPGIDCPKCLRWKYGRIAKLRGVTFEDACMDTLADALGGLGDSMRNLAEKLQDELTRLEGEHNQ